MNKGMEVKQASPESVEALVVKHLNEFYRQALFYTRNASNAEDLVQDTVERVLKNKDQFEIGTNFKSWSSTILYRSFCGKYRRRRNLESITYGLSRGCVEERMTSQSTRMGRLSAEDKWVEGTLCDELKSALESMPFDYRQVLILRDVEGLSYNEIAQVIDKPAGTVMSRLHRARKMLERQSSLRTVARESGILKSRKCA